MAYSFIGSQTGAVDGTAGANNTIIVLVKVGGGSAASLGRGVLKSIYAKAAGDTTLVVKIFRDDGANWVFIGECSVPVLAGENFDVPCIIPGVEVGDYIAWYSTGNLYYGGSGAGEVPYRTGNISSTLPYASWSSGNGRRSLGGKIFTRVAPL